MKTRFKNAPHIEKVAKEMCKRVGADFNKINFKKPEWFMRYSWTDKEEDKFREWFINYLKKNKEARREIMNFPSAHKDSLEKVAGIFLLNYGWKSK